MFTKKYMVEDYPRLRKHSDLLDLYLYDTQMGHAPDATETYKDSDGWNRVQLWRASSASGGYVVIKESLPNIWTLDDAMEMYRDNPSQHVLELKCALERLTIRRNKITDASMQIA